MKAALDEAGITNQDQALRQAAGQAFYSTSRFTLRDLEARASQQQLEADFEAYLDGFSPNVQDILENFEFRNQIPRLSKADALGTLIEKLLSPDINLSPNPVRGGEGSVKHPGLDNHGMGTVFEKLVRRFNEENNEEAGEHWTPRDAVKLMATLLFLPIADGIESGTYLLCDAACGTGGMLTAAEKTLQVLARQHGKQVATHLYGQEINAETYAICKADLLLEGEGDAADNIVGSPEHSTLANDAFPSREFDLMLSNPPYGKSWKSDLERMGGKAGIKDPRLVIAHGGDPKYSLITRSSDGQILFLANMLSKMKRGTQLGSGIAEVHNGSSLFTGDAGQGESNIRRWIIENDWLDAIVALPLNMFYDTGIATYVWVLANRKPAHRQGKVQLIDARQWFKPLRKNLGKKNCELSDEDFARICEAFLKREVLPHVPDAWVVRESVKTGYEISFTRYFCKPQPLRTLGEIRADILELERATEGLLGDRRIRRYIRAKQKLIKLLEEQKQAIIHRAVTRGLDPNVRLEPSGVGWLGDVPERWEVTRATHLFREVDHRTTTETEVLLSLRMHRGLVPHADVSTVPITAQALIGFKKIAVGQVVMNRMRAAIGLFGIASEPGLVSPDYAVLEPLVTLDPHCFSRLFRTPAAGTVFRVDFEGLGTGSSGFVRLYTDRFGTIKLPVPPAREQQQIVEGIVESTLAIERITERVNREMRLLREYRTRLIADVVTGTLDVREAAARLPEQEVEEAELFDEAEAESDAQDAEADDTGAAGEEAEA